MERTTILTKLFKTTKGDPVADKVVYLENTETKSIADIVKNGSLDPNTIYVIDSADIGLVLNTGLDETKRVNAAIDIVYVNKRAVICVSLEEYVPMIATSTFTDYLTPLFIFKRLKRNPDPFSYSEAGGFSLCDMTAYLVVDASQWRWDNDPDWKGKGFFLIEDVTVVKLWRQKSSWSERIDYAMKAVRCLFDEAATLWKTWRAFKRLDD